MKILNVITKAVKHKYPMIDRLTIDAKNNLYIEISINKLLSKYPDMEPIRYFKKPNFKPTEYVYLGTILVGDSLWDNSEDVEILDYFGDEIMLYIEKIFRLITGDEKYYRSSYFLIVP